MLRYINLQTLFKLPINIKLMKLKKINYAAIAITRYISYIIYILKCQHQYLGNLNF